MKTTTVSLTVALALLVGLSACSTTRSAGTQMSDAAVTSKVKAKLAADPEVMNLVSIDVDTNEGEVRLSGHVDTEAQKAEAEKLARQTDGVRDVDNEIEVGKGRTIGGAMDDALITSKIKAKLTGDLDVNPFNVDVDTDRGNVVLTGRVNTAAEKATVERIARGTEGVLEVENRLLVGQDADANADID